MSDKRRVISDPKQGVSVMSVAAEEAFSFLNALTRKNYRGCGDTPTAARNRAAREAGITPAQAERLWKRWKTMASVDGDVYRALMLAHRAYVATCERIEAAADALERKRLETTGLGNAAFQSPVPSGAGTLAVDVAAEQETT